ncbi:MAG: hypothetical protein RM347_025150 [Nostoc sp. ChiQUE02]|uniref:hypothetical protein n=1 Tax=Nostoc sp. ChiQUE02 TaxID=3075377 RepID=UPI002AD47E73|nr:hypothetical protein [Nostoc sp. ChiQUE02]
MSSYLNSWRNSQLFTLSPQPLPTTRYTNIKIGDGETLFGFKFLKKALLPRSPHTLNLTLYTVYPFNIL